MHLLRNRSGIQGPRLPDHHRQTPRFCGIHGWRTVQKIRRNAPDVPVRFVLQDIPPDETVRMPQICIRRTPAMIFSAAFIVNRETRKVHGLNLNKKRVVGFSCFFMETTKNIYNHVKGQK